MERDHMQVELETCHYLNLELTLQPSSPAPEPLQIFPCNYCGRKFYSPQALGGHQNAHKYERSMARRHREQLAAAVDNRASPCYAAAKGHPTSVTEQGEVDLSLRL